MPILNLKEMSESMLVDMLAEQTARLTRLFRTYNRSQNDTEYQVCKETIQQIVEELSKRRMLTKKPTRP